jgi:hypothetical protein
LKRSVAIIGELAEGGAPQFMATALYLGCERAR